MPSTPARRGSTPSRRNRTRTGSVQWYKDPKTGLMKARKNPKPKRALTAKERASNEKIRKRQATRRGPRNASRRSR